MTAKRMTTQHVLQRLGGDGFLQKLLEQVRTIGMATDETGRPGQVTLTIKTIKPKEGETGDQYVAFETESKIAKMPTPKPRRTGLYVSDEGLHVEPPLQEELDLRVVETSEGETRQVPAGTPAVRSV